MMSCARKNLYMIIIYWFSLGCLRSVMLILIVKRIGKLKMIYVRQLFMLFDHQEVVLIIKHALEIEEILLVNIMLIKWTLILTRLCGMWQAWYIKLVSIGLLWNLLMTKTPSIIDNGFTMGLATWWIWSKTIQMLTNMTVLPSIEQ